MRRARPLGLLVLALALMVLGLLLMSWLPIGAAFVTGYPLCALGVIVMAGWEAVR